jgi:hypothetical protein
MVEISCSAGMERSFPAAVADLPQPICSGVIAIADKVIE